MIDNETTTQIRMDYYQSDDQNTLLINAGEAAAFWEWFQNSAVAMEPIDPTNIDIGQHYGTGNCFANTRIEATRHGQAYYEGFIVVHQHHYLHGFNVIDGQVLDVTALSNPNDFRSDNGEMPSRYYGIRIPDNLIEVRDDNTCLLRTYFLIQNAL